VLEFCILYVSIGVLVTLIVVRYFDDGKKIISGDTPPLFVVAVWPALVCVRAVVVFNHILKYVIRKVVK